MFEDTNLTGFTEEQRELIKEERRNINRKKSDSKSTNCKVTKGLCEWINSEYESGAVPSDIINDLHIQSVNTLWYHIRGDCSHDTQNTVSYNECGWMIYHALNGAPAQTLAVLYDIDRESVIKHLKGDCRHEHNLPTLDTKKLHRNAHGTPFNYKTSECENCGTEFRHKKYRDRTTCSQECKMAYITAKSVKSRTAGD